MEKYFFYNEKTNGQTAKIALSLLFGAIIFLQPVPEAFADISVKDKEVLEAKESIP
jgi:hypothetical protein